VTLKREKIEKDMVYTLFFIGMLMCILVFVVFKRNLKDR